ncbi:hypothetical protein C8F04DRAFT_277556 [Mycena alexandri]|uniref:Uncharacterized protein n=1 Tax=Mycena alexandri TaxID=1745969 RepID=A0AAD6S4C0_9AGAR|nr:hypothetical protein C8F04DRAFT_277556 [Mycena alexandri]
MLFIIFSLRRAALLTCLQRSKWAVVFSLRPSTYLPDLPFRLFFAKENCPSSPLVTNSTPALHPLPNTTATNNRRGRTTPTSPRFPPLGSLPSSRPLPLCFPPSSLLLSLLRPSHPLHIDIGQYAPAGIALPTGRPRPEFSLGEGISERFDDVARTITPGCHWTPNTAQSFSDPTNYVYVPVPVVTVR